MIAIVDYGVGNLRNVYKALERQGMESVITGDEEVINKSSAIILPGVGAFKDAMDNLRSRGLVNCLKENAKSGKIMLGICLGMQLLYEKSFEDGEDEGLGILQGEVVRFNEGLKIPHMGWNSLVSHREDELTRNIENGEYVYFVHSYYIKSQNTNDIVFSTDYGVQVPAVVRRGSIIGMQFHPEKSGKTGEKLLSNFKELIG